MRTERFRNLPLEEPRVVDQAVICTHPDADELYVYDNEILDGDTKTDKIAWGRVGIMRVMIDANTTGFVADLRYVKDPSGFDETEPDEPPDDQEEFNGWQQLKRHEHPISAVVFYEEDRETTGWLGDEAFREAAFALAKLIDETRVVSGKRRKSTKMTASGEQPVRLHEKLLALVGIQR